MRPRSQRRSALPRLLIALVLLNGLVGALVWADAVPVRSCRARGGRPTSRPGRTVYLAVGLIDTRLPSDMSSWPAIASRYPATRHGALAAAVVRQCRHAQRDGAGGVAALAGPAGGAAGRSIAGAARREQVRTPVAEHTRTGALRQPTAAVGGNNR